MEVAASLSVNGGVAPPQTSMPIWGRARRQSIALTALITMAAPGEVICKIFLGPPQTERTGVTRNIVLRHEIGHCEGWPADHSNPKAAPLQLAADEGVAPVEYGEAGPNHDELPPPQRRHPRPRYHEPYPPPPPPGVLYEPWTQRAVLHLGESRGLGKVCSRSALLILATISPWPAWR